jgi:DNA-binding beta-propeller fold protein YncE
MRIARLGLAGLLGCILTALALIRPVPAQSPTKPEVDRSPVDVVLSPDEQWLVTVNQTSHSLSLVEVATGKVHDEIACGQRPSALAWSRDGKTLVASGTYSGDVTTYHVADKKLTKAASLWLGFEPRGVVLSPDDKRAYVALTTAHQIAVVDLATMKEQPRIDLKRWPRYLAITPDGKKLAVGTSGDGGVSVVDLSTNKLAFAEEFAGINLGQMEITRDGKHAYFPWMVYRHNPITPNNIRIGWVLASRVARVNLDAPARREAMALDPPGVAVSDPHGIALSPDEKTLVVAASGTHELLVMPTDKLPLQDYGGTDHLPLALQKDKSRFDRIPLEGRPMAIRYSKDGRRVFVANYLLNAVQVVDVPAKKITQTISLGGPAEPSLARRGETIFTDGRRSLDQWYSCHSCHYEGHVNSVSMDTRNDGRFGNFKTVLSLRNVTHTGPYFWHGWEKDLSSAVKRSMTDSMLGKEPTRDDVAAVLAYLQTLTPPPNPHRGRDGKLSEAARRGEVVFKGEKANCARCHSGDYFTDGRIHLVGTQEKGDVYKGYNPPSLLGIYDRAHYLHDGRSRTLEELLRGPHNPDRVTGRGELTDDELRDLLAYVRSL